jgi:hypothetical protein
MISSRRGKRRSRQGSGDEGVWVGGLTTRGRRFTFGNSIYQPSAGFDLDVLALHPVLASGGHREVAVAIGGSGKRISIVSKSSKTEIVVCSAHHDAQGRVLPLQRLS